MVNEPNKSNTVYLECEDLFACDQMFQTDDISEIRETNVRDLNAIGGWLIFLGIGRILSPIVILQTIFLTYLPIFTNGSLEKLSQTGNAAYSMLWKPTMMFELGVNIILLIFAVILLFSFFGRKKWFPKIFICLSMITIIFAIIDAVLITQIQSSLSLGLNINPVTQIISPVVIGAIWIPYLIISNRVKNTFVK